MCINTVFSPLCDKLNLFFSSFSLQRCCQLIWHSCAYFFRSEFMRLLCQTLRHTHTTTKKDYTSWYYYKSVVNKLLDLRIIETEPNTEKQWASVSSILAPDGQRQLGRVVIISAPWTDISGASGRYFRTMDREHTGRFSTMDRGTFGSFRTMDRDTGLFSQGKQWNVLLSFT